MKIKNLKIPLAKIFLVGALCCVPTTISIAQQKKQEKQLQSKKLDAETFETIMYYFQFYDIKLRDSQLPWYIVFFNYLTTPALLGAASATAWFVRKHASEKNQEVKELKAQFDAQTKSFNKAQDHLCTRIDNILDNARGDSAKFEKCIIEVRDVLKTLPTYEKATVVAEKTVNEILEG